jgi:hypothetical protein
LAALSVEPMVAKSVAADVIISGAAITNDIGILLPDITEPPAETHSIALKSPLPWTPG